MRVCLSLFMCVIVFSRWVALVTEWQSPGVDGETATKSLFWAPTYSSPVPPIPVLPLLSLHANKTVLGIYWLQTKDGPDHSALWADTCILWGIAAEHFRREVFFWQMVKTGKRFWTILWTFCRYSIPTHRLCSNCTAYTFGCNELKQKAFYRLVQAVALHWVGLQWVHWGRL